MNVLLGIEIPEDLSALSPEELSTLVTSLKGAIVTALSGATTPDVATEAEAADEIITKAEAEIEARTEAEAELSARRDALLSKFSESDEGDEGEAEGEDDADDEGDDTELADESTEDESEGDAVTASTWKPTLSAIDATAPKAPAKAPARTAPRTFADIGFQAVSSIGGVAAGETFEDKREFAEALASRWDTIKGGSKEKVAVARLSANFSEAQMLTGDPDADLIKLGGGDVSSEAFQNAVTAAFCPPEEPLYEFATKSSLARPVKASLATYRPKRGAVSVPQSPNLSDVESQGEGYGIWTSTDDVTPESSKVCATVPCPGTELYEMYGIWRCLRVKNMMAMTWPELVDAILNRLGALHSRLGERTLLDAMLASTNTVAMNVNANAYGSSINLLTTILNAVAIHREEERYDSGQRFDTWMHRSVLTALQIDLANQRREGGSLRARLAPASDVNAALREAGLNVTWTYDTASTWAQVPAAVDGQDLPTLAPQIDLIMTPAGNFRALDRGELTIGVTNGGIYRDNASNAVNEFSIFQENFEGLLDMGARTYSLTITDACYGGAQTADVTSITCPANSGS